MIPVAAEENAAVHGSTGRSRAECTSTITQTEQGWGFAQHPSVTDAEVLSYIQKAGNYVGPGVVSLRRAKTAESLSPGNDLQELGSTRFTSEGKENNTKEGLSNEVGLGLELKLTED
ncbi:uncharacterized protein GJ701_011496 [Geothlypis trichas]